MSPEAKVIHEMMKDCAAKLREHCDSVQIVCTIMPDDDDGNTEGLFHGSGNLYARIGGCTEWLQMLSELVRIKARKDAPTE